MTHKSHYDSFISLFTAISIPFTKSEDDPLGSGQRYLHLEHGEGYEGHTVLLAFKPDGTFQYHAVFSNDDE
jgi:hypothetical protein